MSTGKKSEKCRNFMYTQQVAHLPNNMSLDDLYSIVDSQLKPKKWAGILHEHDIKDDNVSPAEAHVHLMMQFENARSLKQIAKEIGDDPQYIEKWKGDVSNGFAYLVHATKNARHKHQYSCDEVKANFDYISYMNQVMRRASKVEGVSSANKVNGLLDLIGAGVLSLKDAKNQLSGSVYAKNSDKLKKAHELYLERRADTLYREMEENNELCEVHWFYGKSESGKTFLAEKLAKAQGEYYLTSTTRDAFEYYQAEPIILLDELRPESIPFSELLAMFNPFSRGKVTASSRYHNKPLACRTFFVTTPYNPLEFCYAYHLDQSDSIYQLCRRLASVLMFDEEYIYNMEYDKQQNRYISVDKKHNPYSKRNQKAYSLNNIFKII